MRLRRPDELKYEENGFFEKSSDIYDHEHTYNYTQKVNSRQQRYTKNSSQEKEKCPRVSRTHRMQDHASFVVCEIQSDNDEQYSGSEITQLPHFVINNESYKMNGSARINGSVHEPFHSISARDNIHEDAKFETSKI